MLYMVPYMSFIFLSPLVMSTNLIMYQLYGYLGLKQKEYGEYLVRGFKLPNVNAPRAFERVKTVQVRPAEDPAEASNKGSSDGDEALALFPKIWEATRLLNQAYKGFAFMEVASHLYTWVGGAYVLLMSVENRKGQDLPFDYGTYLFGGHSMFR